MTIFFFQKWKEKRIRAIPSDDKITTEDKLPLLGFPSACNKLYRTDYLLDNKLYFPEGLAYEDNLVNWKAITSANRISIVPERLYHHRRNFDSITRTAGEHWMDLIPIYNKIGEYLLASGYYAAYRNKYISMKLDVWFRHYRNLPASMKPDYAAMVRESLTADDREFYRTAPKKQLRNIARLFYAMLDGDKTDAQKFCIAYTIHQTVRMPELFFRWWIVRPLRQWKTNRDC